MTTTQKLEGEVGKPRCSAERRWSRRAQHAAHTLRLPAKAPQSVKRRAGRRVLVLLRPPLGREHGAGVQREAPSRKDVCIRRSVLRRGVRRSTSA